MSALPAYLPAQEVKPNRDISFRHHGPLIMHLQTLTMHTTVTKSKRTKYNGKTMLKVKAQKGQSRLMLTIKQYKVLQKAHYCTPKSYKAYYSSKLSLFTSCIVIVLRVASQFPDLLSAVISALKGQNSVQLHKLESLGHIWLIDWLQVKCIISYMQSQWLIIQQNV